jgi:Tol biopolymer transport system component/predicted Ser/Thr protein kinase
MADLIGSVVANFRIEQLIGSGGMSQVYRGTHVHLGRVAAIKVMHSQFSGDTSFQQRFLREALVAAQLHHPNIVEIYDTGVASEGAYYIAMEYVAGRNLSQMLKLQLPSHAQTVSYVGQVAAALDHAHAAGVIHRDVKPSNIIVRPDGRVVLVDFGIAKALEEHAAAQSGALTMAGAIVGTPAYLAPEQASDEPVTKQTDIYALGIVTYELLSGKPPFSGRSFSSMLNAHLTETPPPVHTLVGQLDPRVSGVIARALEKDPRARYPSATEFAAALSAALPHGAAPAAAAVAAGEAVPSAASRDGALPPMPPEATTAGAGGRGWSRATLLVFALVAVALAAAGFLLLGGDDGDDDDDSTLATSTSTAGTVVAAATSTSLTDPTATLSASDATATPAASATEAPATEPPATQASSPAATETVPPEAPNANLAFQSARDGNFEIYVMNPDGSAQTNITNVPANDLSPVWSPDGGLIAFASDRSGSYEIWVMNANGSDPRQLTDSPGRDVSPAWSPDGSLIAFASERDGNFEIYTMDVDGGSPQRITDAPSADAQPAWSPDGARIAYESDRAAPVGQEFNRFDIWIMDAAGGNPQRLTTAPESELSPEWSPDGARIAYSVERRDGPTILAYEIYVIGADGSNPFHLEASLTADAAPVWSPDGRFIAFQSLRNGVDWHIYIMRGDGSGQTPLTTAAGDDTLPSWSPLLTQTAAGD